VKLCFEGVSSTGWLLPAAWTARTEAVQLPLASVGHGLYLGPSTNICASRKGFNASRLENWTIQSARCQYIALNHDESPELESERATVLHHYLRQCDLVRALDCSICYLSFSSVRSARMCSSLAARLSSFNTYHLAFNTPPFLLLGRGKLAQAATNCCLVHIRGIS